MTRPELSEMIAKVDKANYLRGRIDFFQKQLDFLSDLNNALHLTLNDQQCQRSAEVSVSVEKQIRDILVAHTADRLRDTQEAFDAL